MDPEELRYDGKGKGKGKVVEEEQVLQMSNERFTVPECLFNPSSIGKSVSRTPSDPGSTRWVEENEGSRIVLNQIVFAGMNQSGLAESIAHSIASLPEEVRGMFWANIVCVGGNAGFDGFGQRLYVPFLPLSCINADWTLRLIESQN